MPQATQITELNAFSGGMNNVTAPYLIRKDESVVLTNVNLRRGSMESVPRLIRKQDVGYVYFYQFGNHLLQYGRWRANVVWDNKLYWTDGVTTGKILFDGTEMSLGLDTPVEKLEQHLEPAEPPVVDPDDPSYDPDVIGAHTGNFKYTYTFYDSEHGVESAPAPLSLYSEPKAQNIRLTGFSPLPEGTDKYRIYRIGGYLPYFQRVDDYDPNEEDPDNPPPVEDYEFLDDLDDTQIDGSELLTLETGKPPDQIAYFVEMAGRMYGAVDNILYYSALGNPDAWYINDFFQMKGKIRGLAATPGGLLVMGDYYTNILKGTQPNNFVLRLLSDKIGCREASSIAYIDTTAIWLSYHGVVMSDGFAIRQLTADRIEDISGLNPTGADVINNMYFMSYKPILTPSDELFPDNELYPDGVVGTGGVEQGIITLDFKRGNGYAYKIYTFDLVQYLGTLDGKIGVIHGDPYTPLFPTCDEVGFPDCWAFIPCSGMELAYLNTFPMDQFELKHLAEMEYMSPLMVDGSTAMLKEYDKVRVIFRGQFNMRIYFDNNRQIQEQDFESPDTGIGLEFTETTIGIPNNDNKAYSIRFHVIGRGTIKGIQYSYKFRENMP